MATSKFSILIAGMIVAGVATITYSFFNKKNYRNRVTAPAHIKTAKAVFVKRIDIEEEKSEEEISEYTEST